jgi:hypothetical protein
MCSPNSEPCLSIFTEKASAKSTNGRTEFNRLMRALKPGDTVVVTRLDRLARSSRDLHNILGQGMIANIKSPLDLLSQPRKKPQKNPGKKPDIGENNQPPA